MAGGSQDHTCGKRQGRVSVEGGPRLRSSHLHQPAPLTHLCASGFPAFGTLLSCFGTRPVKRKRKQNQNKTKKQQQKKGKKKGGGTLGSCCERILTGARERRGEGLCTSLLRSVLGSSRGGELSPRRSKCLYVLRWG